MIHTFTATNTNTLAPQVYKALSCVGVKEHTRNGDVLRFPGSITVELTRPWERVNFSPARDANPFFHLMEAMCMLGAENDAPFLSHFAKNMINYSDDGETFNAFYGTRAREMPVVTTDGKVAYRDQLKQVVNNLLKDVHSRRELILLGSADDLFRYTRDKACNLVLVFQYNQATGVLDMHTFNRSNDAVWGFVTGANIVHFSYFHEYVACGCNIPMGHWYHTSSNMHVYITEQWSKVLHEARHEPQLDPYSEYSLPASSRLFSNLCDNSFDARLTKFLFVAKEAVDNGRLLHQKQLHGSTTEGDYLEGVVLHVFNAWQARKIWLAEDSEEAHTTCKEEINLIASPDWQAACSNWVERRNVHKLTQQYGR